MRRGTTPTLTITLDGVLVSDLGQVFVTFEQKGIELTKQNDDITLDVEANAIIVPFSQEDTLTFNQGPVNCQLRALLADGTTAIASKIKAFSMDKVLLDGVITANEE